MRAGCAPSAPILCLLDDKIVPFRFAGVESDTPLSATAFSSPDRTPSSTQAATRRPSKPPRSCWIRRSERKGSSRAPRRGQSARDSRSPQTGATRSHRTTGCRKKCRSRRMAGGAHGPNRPALSGLAARGAAHGHAHPSALFRPAQGKQAGAPLHHGRQLRDPGRQRRHHRRQRAGAARPPRRCTLFLGSGQAPAAGRVPAGVGRRRLPRPPRLHAQEGRSHCEAGAYPLPVDQRCRSYPSEPRRRFVQGRSCDRDGRRIPRPPGGHG